MKMKPLTFVVFLYFSTSVLAQNIKTDTIFARNYWNTADEFYNAYNFDSAAVYYLKTKDIYEKYKVFPNYFFAFNKYAYTLCVLGKYHESDSLFNVSLKAALKKYGKKSACVADVYHKTGNLYMYTGDFDKAIEQYNTALEIKNIIYGKEHKETLNTINSIANYYYNISEFKKSRDLSQYLVKSYFKKYGTYCVEVADSYNCLASTYTQTAQHDSSLFYYNIAHDIKLKLFGEKHAEIANSYNNLATAYWSLGELDKAKEYLLKAVDLYIELYGENFQYLYYAYLNLGGLYTETGNYRAAEKYLLISKKMREDAMGTDHPMTADAYMNIGNLYVNMSEFEKAENYYEKALKIFLDNFGLKSHETASVYLNIATLHFGRGDQEKALKYNLKSLEIKKQLNDINSPNIITCYNMAAVIYQFRGEYDIALQYLQKAFDISTTNFGDDDYRTANVYFNTASIYADKKEFDKALEFNFKALKSRLKNLDSLSVDISQSYQNIGNIYTETQNFVQALNYYNKSMYILQKNSEFNAPNYPMIFESFAELYLKQNNIDSSLFYAQKALNSSIKIYGKRNFNTAKLYNLLGDIAFAESNFDKAMLCYQKAIVFNTETFTDSINFADNPTRENPFKINVLSKSILKKASCFEKKYEKSSSVNDLISALTNYMAADKLFDKFRQQQKSEKDKILLGKETSEMYEKAINLCYKLFQTTKNKEYIETCFYFSEKNKSAILLEALSGSEAQNFAGIPDKLLEKEHQLSTDITFFQNKLAEDPENPLNIEFRSKLFDLNTSYDSLIAVFENKYPKYFRLKYYTQIADSKEISKILDKKTALLSYFVGDNSAFVFIIDKKNLNIAKLELNKNFSSDVTLLRESFFSTQNQDLIVFIEKSNLIFNSLLAGKIPSKIENLIFIPDGILNKFPFEVLLYEKYNGTPGEFEKYPFLIKNYNISYSYSANLFYKTNPKTKEEGPEIKDLRDWLALAPVFNDANTSETSLRTRALVAKCDNSLIDKNTRGCIIRGNRITPLPGTESEVKEIFNLFDSQNRKAEVKLYNTASEKYMKSDSISKFRTIHIATHGFVNSENPELSGILLSPSDSVFNDGILSAGEIYNLKLNSDLVVLSACETGLGKFEKGEGVIGLTRALLYAGTKNIIVSLWQVSDASTSQLMIDFYTKYLGNQKKKKNFAPALAGAKRKLISEKKYAHPFYWSPFILIGK